MKADISKFGLGFIFSVLMLSSVGFAQGIQDLINVAKDVGVFQFYLPFIIAFTILFGLLQKIQIFGEKGKPLNIIVSLSIAAFVMVYTPVGITLSQFFTSLFGNAIVVILTIVVIAIFASVLSSGGIFEYKKITEGKTYWVALVIFILLAFGVFVASGGTSIFPGIKISPQEWLSPLTGIFGVSSTTLALIILIVGTGIIVWLFAKGGPAAPAGGAGGGGT